MLYDAAVASVGPAPLVAAALREEHVVTAGQLQIIAVGKAAQAMTEGAAAAMQRWRVAPTGGLIVAAQPGRSPAAPVELLVGDHPRPGSQSAHAANQIAGRTHGMRGGDVNIVLLSGGGSSLIAAPVQGVPALDFAWLFDAMLRSGLDIAGTNRIRKRFAQWGAGRLALALAPARTHVFVLSDVPGDDPADVASGPCSPDTSTIRDVVDLLTFAGLLDALPTALQAHISRVARGLAPETPKPPHPAFAHVATRVIGNNALALDAIRARADAEGLRVERPGAFLTGDAAHAGSTVAETLVQRAGAGFRGCMVWGAETTVATATSGAQPEDGGRCQELALAAAAVLNRARVPGSRITLLAAGTDGRDGATEAAGAVVDETTRERLAAAGHDLDDALRRHASHAALAAAGALMPRRHTGTNVMDVVIAVIE